MNAGAEKVMSNVGTVAKHSAIYSFAEILKKGIGFVMIPLYTHYLTPADYGVIEVLTLVLEVLGMLVGVRIASSQTRYYHKYPKYEDKREVFTTALTAVGGSSIAAMLVLWVAAGWLARVTLGSANFAPQYQVMILCLGIQNVYLVAENDLIIRKKSLFYSILVIFLMVLSLSLNILFLAVFHMGIWAIIWSMLITKVVNLAVVPICLRGSPLRFSWEKFRPMLQYALPLIPASLAMFFLHFGDRFFLQHYCSLDDVGVYSLGYKFGMVISVLITTPFQRVWGTHSFEIEPQPGAKLVYARVFTYYASLLAFASLGISVFIDDVIGLVAPPNYAAAASIVPMTVLGYTCLGLTNAAALGILISNNTKFLAFIQIPVAVLNTLFNFALIPSYGIRGAAMATLLSFGTMLAATFFISQRLYPIPYEYRRLLTLASLSLILFMASRIVSGPGIFPMLFHAAVVLALPATLALSGFFSREEREAARMYLHRITPWLKKNRA